MSTTSATTNASRSTRRPSDVRSSMDIYLDAAGAYERLTPEQEHAMLCELVALRRARWHALVCEPEAAAVVQAFLATEEADALAPTQVVTSLRAAFARYPGALPAAMVETLDGLDLDTAVADRLQAVVECTAAPGPAREQVRRTGTAMRSARNRFACRNLRLVVRLAARNANARMALADRVQEGNLGLLMAINRFDPERGFRFSTYAASWIRFAITRALINRGRSVRIPAHLHAIFSKAGRTERALRTELGREPTLAEVAAAAGVTIEKIVDAREAMDARVVPLDLPDGDERSTPSLELTYLPNQDAELAIDARRNLAVAQEAFASLEPLEREIVESRLGLDEGEALTLQTLGQRHHLSRERIRQLQNRALGKLRAAVESSPVGMTAFA